MMTRAPADKPELQRWILLLGDADRRILAQSWGLPPDSEPAVLVSAMTDPERVRQQWERLLPAEQDALVRVLQAGGALPVAILQREWGVVRDPSQFANPRAYLQSLSTPPTPAERLYMMGLLVRGHDERGSVFRVLNDLRRLLPAPPPRDLRLRVAATGAPEQWEAGAPEVLDRTVLALLLLAYEGALTTLADGALNKASLLQLASHLGLKSDLRGTRREADWTWIALLRPLVVEAGLLRRTSDGLLHVGPSALGWLGAPRAERLATLVHAWTASPINELTLMCGLSFRGMPLALRLPESRRTVLGLLKSLPEGVWLPAKEIIAEVERVEPDFLRRDGRYDTALIYDYRGELVAGRERWPRVEGELLRVLLLGILNWLGLTDTAAKPEEMLRLTPLVAHVLHGSPPPPDPLPEPLSVQSTFEIICPPGASLLARFQLARIAEPVRNDTAAIYKLTRRSVVSAVERGIDADAILRFLEEHGRAPVPQGVATYIREWAGHVGQLRLDEVALLRADDPLRLVEVRRSRGIDLPPVEELTPTIWKLAQGDVGALLAQLQRAGWSVATNGNPAPAAKEGHKGAISDHDLKAMVTAAHVYAHVCSELGLPCEVSSSMLMRLRKLVPSRQIDAALQAAYTMREHLRTKAAERSQTGERPVGEGNSDA